MAKQKTVWTVTQMNDYCLENQWVYKREESAKAKAREISKELFSDAFEERKGEYEEFDEDSDFMDYQQSTAWWDDDCRISIHLNESVLEGDE